MKISITGFTIYGFSVALALVLLISSASAQDLNEIWTSVGSTGTVDEADTTSVHSEFVKLKKQLATA